MTGHSTFAYHTIVYMPEEQVHRLCYQISCRILLCLIVDIDECTEDTDLCGTGTTCVNTDPGYNCTCNIGYTPNDDGVSCSGMLMMIALVRL